MSVWVHVVCVWVEVDNSGGSWVCRWMSEGLEHENINSPEAILPVKAILSSNTPTQTGHRKYSKPFLYGSCQGPPSSSQKFSFSDSNPHFPP